MATMAASQPLFPAFDPALSIACSIVSAVIIPKETGIPTSRLISAIPLDTSAAM